MGPRTLAWALFTGSVGAAAAGAQELPTLEEFKRRLGEAPRPDSPRAVAAAAAFPAGRDVSREPPFVEVRERLLTLDLVFDLTIQGAPAGMIVSTHEGYVFTDPRGGRVAVSGRTGGSKGAGPASAAVADGAGARIGEIVRTPLGTGGRRSFQVRDAAGATVGDTGEIAFLDPDFTLRSPQGGPLARYRQEGRLGGAWRIAPAPELDARLAVMVLIQNVSEDLRESKRRHDRTRRRRGRHGP